MNFSNLFMTLKSHTVINLILPPMRTTTGEGKSSVLEFLRTCNTFFFYFGIQTPLGDMDCIGSGFSCLFVIFIYY